MRVRGVGGGVVTLVTVVVTARCLRCEWTASGKGADLAARKHTDAETHPTVTEGTVAR